MVSGCSLASLLLLLAASAVAAPHAAPPGNSPVEARQLGLPTGDLLSAYTPLSVKCPAEPLVRQADGSISAAERSWISARKAKADAALQRWLAKTASFGRPRAYPVVALASSGGGLRATLITAGVHQAFDARDSPNAMGGLLQSLTYETGLSGGAWALGSISGNGYPAVSDLAQSLWYRTFQNSLLLPDNLLVLGPLANIIVDVTAKGLAGFGANVVDLYGRLLGYMLLDGATGGSNTTMSALLGAPNFANHEVPFPIITAVGTDLGNGYCGAPSNGAQYELSPLEFGSFDKGVNAFMTSKYLGSAMRNGKPATAGRCNTNFDNYGYAMGASSNIFTALCAPALNVNNAKLLKFLQGTLNGLHGAITKGLYATIPNPFQGLAGSSAVSGFADLTLIDGGSTGQNNPIWPMLHRNVDVLFVSDSTSGPDNFPSGKELHNTFEQDRQQGVNRMPEIPVPAEIDASKPSFFGCHDAGKLLVIYMPNRPYNYAAGTPQGQVQYSEAQTKGMIKNGVASASYGGKAGWNVCVGCAIMKNAGGSLPSACGNCFSQHCVN